jgi:hypothetical protein
VVALDRHEDDHKDRPYHYGIRTLSCTCLEYTLLL